MTTPPVVAIVLLLLHLLGLYKLPIWLLIVVILAVTLKVIDELNS